MILQQLDRLPPNCCRLIARKPSAKGVPLSDAEIAADGGLSIQQVVALSRLKSWEMVPVGTVDKFRTGCGITPSNMRRHIAYLKSTLGRAGKKVRHGLKHLERLPPRTATRIAKSL